LTPTDDPMRYVEDVDYDPPNASARCTEIWLELEDRLDGGLGVYLRVMALEGRPGHSLEILRAPVDRKGPADGVHEALVPFESLGRPRDSVAGEPCRLRAFPRGVRRGESLPVRERSRARDAKRGRSRHGNRDRIRRAGGVEPDRAADAGGGCDGPLR